MNAFPRRDRLTRRPERLLVKLGDTVSLDHEMCCLAQAVKLSERACLAPRCSVHESDIFSKDSLAESRSTGVIAVPQRILFRVVETHRFQFDELSHGEGRREENVHEELDSYCFKLQLSAPS
jgi:hypothetical protein